MSKTTLSQSERFVRHLMVVMIADFLMVRGLVSPGDPVALSIAETEVAVTNLRTREVHRVDVRPYLIEAVQLTNEPGVTGADVERLMGDAPMLPASRGLH